MSKRPLCLLCLLFMAGIWVLELWKVPERGAPSNNPVIQEYLESHSKRVQIYGQIYRRLPDGSAIYLKNSYLQVQSDIIPLENVKVYMEENDSRLFVGAGVLVVGKLQAIPRAGNPGQFDSVRYYETQHIYYRMVKTQVTVKDKPWFSYRETLTRVRVRLEEVLNAGAGDYAPVYDAMLLGDKSLLEDEVKDRYQMGGMLHMLAISGLHLSLIGMGCYQLLSRVGASVYLAGSISTFLLFSYGILTGEGTATMRALGMFVLMMGAKILGRSYDLLSAMAFSAILILMDSPCMLFYSGFLLSFSCILGVGLVLPRLSNLLKLKRQNPKKKKISIAVANALTASLAIQMATLPITLYFFYEFPMYGIFLNLLVIPTLSVVLLCGILSCALGLFLPAAGRLVLIPGNILLDGYELLGKVAQCLPMTTWVAGQPKLWQVWCYYVILVGGFLGAEKIRSALDEKKKREVKKQRKLHQTGGEEDEEEEGKKNKKLVEIIPIGCVAISLSLGIFTLAWHANPELSITCLDVGQGDCAVVSMGTGFHMMIDGGSSNVQEVGRYRMLPYLKSQGISTLDYVWVSHSDLDHISGILEILKLQKMSASSVTIRHLLLPDLKETDDNYQELVEAGKQAQVDIHYMHQGNSLREDNLTCQVLWPRAGDVGEANDLAQVFLLDYGAFQGLFTGDIGEKTETQLLNQLVDIDFLKVAHHGSKYSTIDSFLARTKPELSVISCSATNTYGHPSPDTLKRLEQAGSAIFCTKNRGAVTLSLEKERVRVTGFLKIP